MITPNTKIILLKCPLTLSNKNQLTFANKEAQYNYFYNLEKIEEDECQYQRKDNVIRFPAHFDEIQEYNYCMYQNENYGNKWFYAFITNIQYVNDATSYITIKTDVFQTWQFDLNWKRSFVEREHVQDDTIGLHTIPENLDVGELVEEFEQEDISLSQYYFVGVLTSHNPATNSDFNGPYTIINKNIMAKKLCLFENIESDPSLGLFLMHTNANSHTNDIDTIFFIPDILIDRSKMVQNSATYGGQNYTFYTMQNTSSIVKLPQTIAKQHTFSDFSPKNNKCFVYPYNFLFVSNNVGNQNIYKYEDFSENNATFDIEVTTSVGISGRLVPKNYKNQATADDEIISLAKFPTIAWSSDSYTNWLTQQAVNIPTNLAFSTFETASQIATGDAVGAGVNIASNIASSIGSFFSASLLPNVTHGQNTADINFLAERNTFTFRGMRAKTEYLKEIDDYFTMYGYKVNSLKIPNLTGRPNWNYVKTIGANILGNLPQFDLQEIKEMFNNGVTLWHNPSTFLDYSQSNN